MYYLKEERKMEKKAYMIKSSKTTNRGPAINENISSNKVRVVSEKAK